MLFQHFSNEPKKESQIGKSNCQLVTAFSALLHVNSALNLNETSEKVKSLTALIKTDY